MSDAPRRLTLLGSTGSVGARALEVVRRQPGRLAVHGLAARGGRGTLLLDQVREFRPQRVAVVEAAAAALLRAEMPELEVLEGEAGVVELAGDRGADRVLAAQVGVAGLPAVHAALEAGLDVALANKESLVVAGELLLALARQRGARLLPVDSEHAALHQALAAATAAPARLVLTASGGPFRQRPIETFPQVTPEEALRHPTWDMGRRISVDSATLMNKGFEVLEAAHLFQFAPDAIEVVLHPQSTVHALVEFEDGNWLAQLCPNDMAFPLQYALAWPQRWPNAFARLDPVALGSLEFAPVDAARYPALGLARAAQAAGGTAPAVLNAADEVAVAAFLDGRLDFPGIAAVVEEVLADHRPQPLSGIPAVFEADAWARQRAGEAAARRRAG